MKFMLKMRLSLYFWLYLGIFALLLTVLPRIKFESPALTLFSVNSFLYGFYIAPILTAQKARIEELHKIVRLEANAIFGLALLTKRSNDPKFHDQIIDEIEDYTKTLALKRDFAAAEVIYEKTITELIGYKGKDPDIRGKMLDQMVSNQINRSNLQLQIANRVFSNEWWIMLVLFTITMSFILLIDVGDNLFLFGVKVLLCTGLSMLLTILLKLSTLTHKKAKTIWTPYNKLIESKFYRFD